MTKSNSSIPWVLWSLVLLSSWGLFCCVNGKPLKPYSLNGAVRADTVDKHFVHLLTPEQVDAVLDDMKASRSLSPEAVALSVVSLMDNHQSYTTESNGNITQHTNTTQHNATQTPHNTTQHGTTMFSSLIEGGCAGTNQGMMGVA